MKNFIKTYWGALLLGMFVLGFAGVALAESISLTTTSGGQVPLRGTSAGEAKVNLSSVSYTGSLPTAEQGGYMRTANCVEVACGTVGDGGILSLTVETDYRLTNTNNSPVRLNNGGSCVGFVGGTGAIVNEGEHVYWRAPAGVGPDGGMAKYECCALTAHSASAPVIVQACPR